MSDDDEEEAGPIQNIHITATEPAAPRFKLRKRDHSSVVGFSNYTLTKKGVSRYDWTDPYRLAVELSWPQFLALLFSFYFTVTGLFGIAYWLVPGAVANARPHVLADHFFFSLETLATVGYGYMYPATTYAHVVACAEILTGVTFTAILTGLTFGRFSKPKAKFIFAKHPVVTTQNGRATLMLRVGNGRAGVLADAHVKIGVLVSEVTTEGEHFRRTHELSLARRTIPVFPLTWTIVHEIDQASPLYGLTMESFRKADVRLFVSLEARDPLLATVVHDLRDYAPSDVIFGVHYVDMIGEDEEGRPCADMTKISEMIDDKFFTDLKS